LKKCFTTPQTDLIRQKVLAAMPAGKLSARLTQVLELKGAAPITIEEFRNTRQVRNSLAHPTSAAATEVSLTLGQTQKVFDSCLALIKLLAPTRTDAGAFSQAGLFCQPGGNPRKPELLTLKRGVPEAPPDFRWVRLRNSQRESRLGQGKSREVRLPECGSEVIFSA